MGSLSGEVRTEVLCGHICDLEAENAKLRELLIAFERCRYGKCNDKCSMFTPADKNRGVPPVCEAYGVMRKLGIEVN